jgi:hypothetical protein
MITNENFDHLISTLNETGVTLNKESLQKHIQENPGGFDLKINRGVKGQEKESTLFFRNSDKGIMTFTEIKEDNWNYLLNQMKDAGFDSRIHVVLRDYMIKGIAEFEIPYSKKFGEHQDETLSKLHFKVGKNGMYYFNDYSFQVLGLPADDLSGLPQKVFIDNKNWNNNYTPREMHALMFGNSIFKEMTNSNEEVYSGWRTLDFNSVDQKTGNFAKKNSSFDLVEYLQGLPIKEMKTEATAIKIIETLKAGGRYTVTYVHDQTELKQVIQANPKMKSLFVTDATSRTLNEKKNNGQDLKENSHKDKNTPSIPVKGPKTAAEKRKRKGIHK